MRPSRCGVAPGSGAAPPSGLEEDHEESATTKTTPTTMGTQGQNDSAAEDARWIETIRLQRSPLAVEECYALLLKKYWKVVMVLAFSKIADRREAEDISQESFVRAFRSLHRLTQPVAFLGWLLQIARNVTTDHLRARKRHVSLDTLAEAGIVPSVDPREAAPDMGQDLETAEDLEEALGAVSDLPELYREVIVLRYLKGIDGKAMAQLLGEPEGTVRNRLFRALEKLRALVEERRVRKT